MTNAYFMAKRFPCAMQYNPNDFATLMFFSIFVSLVLFNIYKSKILKFLCTVIIILAKGIANGCVKIMAAIRSFVIFQNRHKKKADVNYFRKEEK